MHIHNVYFCLKNGQSAEEIASFERGLDDLIHDDAAKGGHWGRPADTHRPVIERGYDYGMIVVFEDLAGHDRYQTGDNHLRFVVANEHKWDRVVVYDIETK